MSSEKRLMNQPKQAKNTHVLPQIFVRNIRAPWFVRKKPLSHRSSWLSVMKQYIYRIKYWLYVKSGLKKRDEDNWWRGACHANTSADVRAGMIEMKDWNSWRETPQFIHLQGLHAKVEWTRHMRPEWTWKQASDRVINPKW